MAHKILDFFGTRACQYIITLDFEAELAPYIYSMIEKKLKNGHLFKLQEQNELDTFPIKTSIEKFLGKTCGIDCIGFGKTKLISLIL